MTAPYDVSHMPNLQAGDRVGVEIDGRIDVGIFQADGSVDFPETPAEKALAQIGVVNTWLTGIGSEDDLGALDPTFPDEYTDTSSMGWVIGKPVYDFDGKYRGIYRGPDVGIVAE